MPNWITTKEGRKIDLDWVAKSGKDFSTYLKDYYSKKLMSPINISKNAWAILQNAIAQDTKRFINTGIQVQRLDTHKDGDTSKNYDDLYIFEAYGIDNFKVFDKISAKKVEKARAYLDKYWGK